MGSGGLSTSVRYQVVDWGPVPGQFTPVLPAFFGLLVLSVLFLQAPVDVKRVEAAPLALGAARGV